MNKICLIHYHEIGLKGKNRKFFEKRLEQNIKAALASISEGIFMKRISGRILVEDSSSSNLDFHKILNIVTKIPGCARASVGFKCDQTIEAMIEAGCEVMRSFSEGKLPQSFKVSARRNHTNFEKDSMEINQIVGGSISDAFPEVKVQMKDPELDIRVEVIEGGAYVYGTSEAGVGGLPVGTGGDVVSLLSSGIDSPVALWSVARRGAQVTAVHFSGAPIVTNESEYLVKEICENFSRYGLVKKLYIVRIGKFQKKIAEECPERLRIILYRRFMYRCAEHIAHVEDAKALVTGESLGQVASQTIDNLAATIAAVDMQVFRPLIGSDKQEITDRAIQIGTFELSSQKAPDCCTLYMPRNPETHAKIKYVELAEQDLPIDEWITEAIKESEIVSYIS